MAYRFLFAIFPLLLLFVTMLGFAGQALGTGDLIDQFLAEFAAFLPNDVEGLVRDYVQHLQSSRSPGFFTVGLLGTLWGAAGGVGTLIKGMNRAYDVEQERPFWQRQLLALFVTVVLPPAALALLLVGLLGNTLLLWLGLSEQAAGLVSVARWPFLVAVLWLGLSLAYQVLPNRRHSYRWSLLGSAVGAVGWLALTRGFSLYVENFGRYDATYGSFGVAISFLLWLYLSGIVVLVGAEISALAEPRQREDWSRASTSR